MTMGEILLQRRMNVSRIVKRTTLIVLAMAMRRKNVVTVHDSAAIQVAKVVIAHVLATTQAMKTVIARASTMQVAMTLIVRA